MLDQLTYDLQAIQFFSVNVNLAKTEIIEANFVVLLLYSEALMTASSSKEKRYELGRIIINRIGKPT
jgi:hypothetical protein